MRKKNSAGASAELDHLERKGFADDGRLAILLDEVAVERKALVLTLKGNVGTLSVRDFTVASIVEPTGYFSSSHPKDSA